MSIRIWFFIYLSLLCVYDIIYSPFFSFEQSSSQWGKAVIVEAVWTRFDLVRPREGAWGSNGTTPFVRINRPNNTGNLELLSGARFGNAVCNLGDIDGNGFDEIVVGAPGETVNDQPAAGSVYIFFMNENYTYSSYSLINGLKPHQPYLRTGDQFGFSLACIGDLDNNGIFEVAVGAPGLIVSAVYMLYLNRSGHTVDYRMIRGRYEDIQIINGTATNTTSLNNTSTIFNETYIINGPPIAYGSRFGSALAVLDINPESYGELAISSLASTGQNIVYIIFYNQTGWVKSYTFLSPEMGGVNDPYTGFGSSIVQLPKIKSSDEFYTIAIGASRLFEVGSINTEAGSIFLFYVNSFGHVNHSHIIGERSSLQLYGIRLPFVPFESFGSALTTVGDINRDHYRQRWPSEPGWRNRPSIPDLIVGAPQSKSSGGTGRIYFIYLEMNGEIHGYTELPAWTDEITNISLISFEQFGASVAGYQDLDKNGLREILVGSPTRPYNTDTKIGCIYILFPRRRRYHPPPFDYVRYYLMITLPPGLFTLCCCCSIAYFCWYFRRRPDQVEIIVKKSGLQVDPSKPRQKYVRQNVVYIEEYPQ